jgi:hypothetical protein
MAGISGENEKRRRNLESGMAASWLKAHEMAKMKMKSAKINGEAIEMKAIWRRNENGGESSISESGSGGGESGENGQCGII